MNRRTLISGPVFLAMAAILLSAALPAPAAMGDKDASAEKDVRERVVGRRYTLEKELNTDRSLDTWLYVFSALMLLCVGWFCFKPARVYTGKKTKKLAPKKAGSAKKDKK